MTLRKEIMIVPVLLDDWNSYFSSVNAFKRELLVLWGCSETSCGEGRVFSISELVREAVVHEMVVVLSAWDDIWTWSKASLLAFSGNNEGQVFYMLPSNLREESVERAFMGWTMAYHNPSWKERCKALPVLEYEGEFGESAKRGLLVANIVNKSRYLIAAPAESMGPVELEDYARQLASDHNVRLNVIKGEDLSIEFPLVHAVGRSSERKPRVIEINYEGGDSLDLCLIGKGVCFDTGGVNLKPSGAMRLMRKDMGGAAIVLGLADAIMSLELKINLRVIVPAVDNMVSGNSFLPGDVFTSRSGKRVEIGNTDAEGRLLLADCLTWACEREKEHDLIIDVATLTGAARIALGTDMGALFSRDDIWSERIVRAGCREGDYMWRLPLHDDYVYSLKSSIADVVSCSESSYGGAITAALFLEEFVNKDKESKSKWVHIDTMAWNRSSRPGRPEGGESQCLRGLLRALMEVV